MLFLVFSFTNNQLPDLDVLKNAVNSGDLIGLLYAGSRVLRSKISRIFNLLEGDN